MKNLIVVFLSIIFLSGLTKAQNNFNYGNLSSAFNNNFGETLLVNLGIRQFDDYQASLIAGSVSFLDNFAIALEYNNLSYSVVDELLLISLKYKVSDDFVLGTYATHETKRYGVFGVYTNEISSLQYSLSAGFDFHKRNYYLSINNPVYLNEKLFVDNEILVSDGRIFTYEQLELLLVSTGIGYTFYEDITLRGNFGFNLLEDLEDPSYQITISYRM